MYLEAPSIFFAKKGKEAFIDTLNKVQQKERRSKLHITFDMLISNILFGCTFPEYYNLKFYKRTYRNRNTYLTYFSNRRYYKLLNNSKKNYIFHDKKVFNMEFKDFIKRDWISLDDDYFYIRRFFEKYEEVIIKPRKGDSGIGIFKVRTSDILESSEFDSFIKNNKYSLAEEILKNHPKLSELNPHSLNTIRAISIRTQKGVEIIFAGLRVGAPGEIVDNVSKGGKVAVINTATGMLSSDFNIKMTSSEKIKCNVESIVIENNFCIPMWDETKEFISLLANKIPDMKYIAWDIGITEKGPAVIEANHSSGNTICQAHLDIKEVGLRPKVEQIIKDNIKYYKKTKAK